MSEEIKRYNMKIDRQNVLIVPVEEDGGPWLKYKDHEKAMAKSESIQPVITNLFGHIEKLSEEVHNSWWDEKKRQGFHSPAECKSNNKKSYIASSIEAQERFVNAGNNEKFYKWCDKCHTDMYPYAELSENIKDYDRVTVKSVLNAITKVV